MPIVVLGNKVDVPGALTETELRREFGLHFTTGKEPRAWSREAGRPLEVSVCNQLSYRRILARAVYVIAVFA